MSEREDEIDLREYLSVLRARKWSVILTVLLVLGGAVVFSLAQTAMYTAETRVLVETMEGQTTVPNPAQAVDIQTQVEVISSESVAALVRDDIGLDVSIDSILDGLSVAAQGETQVVRISYTAEDPRIAQEIAQSFAENYIDFRRQQALDDVIDEEESLQNQVEAATAQLSDVTADLATSEATRDDALAASLETQRSVLIARLGVLQQQLDDVRSRRTQSSDAGQVIEPATLPESPSSPKHLRNGVVALCLGLALGIALAFARERLDDRFRDRSDVERTVEVPVLATVPRYARPKGDQSPLISVTQSSLGAVEAYRSLRTNLQFLTSQRNTRSVVVTSPSEGEGKSTTVANLGVLLAQAGARVILVSSDLRRPTLAGYFDLPEAVGDQFGLSTWLASGEDEPWALITDPLIPNLRVIPSGPIPPNPAELLSSPRAIALVRQLEANADLVLLDSPPVLAVADASVLASFVGACVLVVNAQSTHKSSTAHARQEIERVGGALIGAVLNGIDASTSSYYYSSYRSVPALAGDGSPAKYQRDSDGGSTATRRRRFLSWR